MKQKIVPNLWFNKNAEEAGKFYAEHFQEIGVDATSDVDARYPHEGLLPFQTEFAGQPLQVSVTIDGFRIGLINAGPEYVPTAALSLMLIFTPKRFGGEAEARNTITALWDRLEKDRGAALMPLQEYDFSPHYGWIQDRYGVSWQLMLDLSGEQQQSLVVPSLLFGGPADGRAAEMVDHYCRLFDDAELNSRVFYPGPKPPSSSVLFSDFTLAGQCFVAMDAGGTREEGFTVGTSLEVRCEDQAEIDRLWEALSTDPGAEQCGWLIDQAGLSWQIVPENLDQLMAAPDAYEKLMGMKKIEIDKF